MFRETIRHGGATVRGFGVGDPVQDAAAALAAAAAVPVDLTSLANTVKGWLAPSAGPTATASLASAAATTLAAVNPCDQTNANLVSAFQQSAGLKVDGEYGTNAAHALAALIPTAPPACHPRPTWWSGSAAPVRVAVVTPPPASPKPCEEGSSRDPKTGLCIPEEKKLAISTGALVAGGVGAIALVAIIAVFGGSNEVSRVRRVPAAPEPVPSTRRSEPTRRSAGRSRR